MDICNDLARRHNNWLTDPIANPAQKCLDDPLAREVERDMMPSTGASQPQLA